MLDIYPYTLVPYVGLQRKMNMDEVVGAMPSLMVARRIDLNDEEIIDLGDGISILTEDMLRKYLMNEYPDMPDKEKKVAKSPIPDMSMSMMTDKSRRDYLKFRQTGNAHTAWNGKNVKIVNYINDIKRSEGRWFSISYRVDELHNKSIPYQGKFKDQEEFDKYKGDVGSDRDKKIILKNFSKNKVYPLIAYIRLEHKPTMMNYWHTTLCVRPFKDSPDIRDSRSKRNHAICEQAFTMILRVVYKINYDGRDVMDGHLFIKYTVAKRKRRKYKKRIKEQAMAHPLA